MIPTAFRPEELFACLARHEVRFVVVGGLAGVAQDAGWPSKDADIVIETSEENHRRLLAALAELDAEYDTLHRPPIRPDLSLLSGSTGPQLFRTKFGRLDVLKEAGGETFETLEVDAVSAEVFGAVLECASLHALLRMKRAASRPKDRAGIAIIESKLEDRRRSSNLTEPSGDYGIDPRLKAIHRILIGLRARALLHGVSMDELASVTDALELAVIDLATGHDYTLAWACLADLARFSDLYSVEAPEPPPPDPGGEERTRRAISWWAGPERPPADVHPDFRWFTPMAADGLHRDDDLIRGFGAREATEIRQILVGWDGHAYAEVISVEQATLLRCRHKLLMRFSEGLLIELRELVTEHLAESLDKG